MSGLCPSFIFLVVLTVVPYLHQVQEGNTNTIFPTCPPICPQVFVCESTECFKNMFGFVVLD